MSRSSTALSPSRSPASPTRQHHSNARAQKKKNAPSSASPDTSCGTSNMSCVHAAPTDAGTPYALHKADSGFVVDSDAGDACKTLRSSSKEEDVPLNEPAFHDIHCAAAPRQTHNLRIIAKSPKVAPTVNKPDPPASHKNDSNTSCASPVSATSDTYSEAAPTKAPDSGVATPPWPSPAASAHSGAMTPIASAETACRAYSAALNGASQPQSPASLWRALKSHSAAALQADSNDTIPKKDEDAVFATASAVVLVATSVALFLGSLLGRVLGVLPLGPTAARALKSSVLTGVLAAKIGDLMAPTGWLLAELVARLWLSALAIASALRKSLDAFGHHAWHSLNDRKAKLLHRATVEIGVLKTTATCMVVAKIEVLANHAIYFKEITALKAIDVVAMPVFTTMKSLVNTVEAKTGVCLTNLGPLRVIIAGLSKHTQ